MRQALFESTPILPDGLRYQENFLSADEEKGLLEKFRPVEFKQFLFQGYTAKRKVAEYGWEYDFGERQAKKAEPIPDFLESLRGRAADFAAIPAQDIIEAIITEYPQGAPIGWHRDVPNFEIIIGISLLSRCVMRFKLPQKGARVTSLVLQPRSIYVMRGAARWEYQHSIPPVKDLRYSVTFRTKK